MRQAYITCIHSNILWRVGISILFLALWSGCGRNPSSDPSQMKAEARSQRIYTSSLNDQTMNENMNMAIPSRAPDSINRGNAPGSGEPPMVNAMPPSDNSTITNSTM